MMLRVYLDDLHLRAAEIPITEFTTCAEVIERCRIPGDKRTFTLIELWRGNGKVIYTTNFLTILFRDITGVA